MNPLIYEPKKSSEIQKDLNSLRTIVNPGVLSWAKKAKRLIKKKW